MKVIWKYTFKITGKFTITMPAGATIVFVHDQQGEPTMWALVDSGNKKEQRQFFLAGTGQPLPGDLHHSYQFLGTFQQGPFVWHVFEAKP